MGRKYWVVLTGPRRRQRSYFQTRQEAVEYANGYYERTGEVVEIIERVRRNGKEALQWRK